MKTKQKTQIRIPASVLQPVNHFFQNRLKELEKQKKNLKKEDPFSNADRTSDNAALVTEAEEQFGHARTAALQADLIKQIIKIKKPLPKIKLDKYSI